MEQAVWIVHRDAQARIALARMVAVPALSGPPHLEAFPPAPAPGAVVLFVELTAQEALAFAHAVAARHPRAQWLLVADPGLDPGWLLAAFAGLRCEILPWPAQPASLQRALRRALASGAQPPAARRQRDALVARFARTFGDLAIPEPVLDASGHLAISGERGTGKLLLARTLHALWDDGEEGRAGFVLLSCELQAAAPEIEAQIAAAAESADQLVVCVENPAALPHAAQRALASWIELGPPAAAIDPARILWVILRPEAFSSLAPLEDSLAELCESPALRIPPLRERPGAALKLAEQWLREWYAAKGEPPRGLADSARDAIARDPWPGNARELEAALRRAVAAPGDSPIEADALGLAAPSAPAPQELAPEPLPPPAASEAAPLRTPDETLDVPARAGTKPPEPAPASAPVPSLPSAPPSDLRSFARVAARDLEPALVALRGHGDDTSAAPLARRLARLQQFSDLEASREPRAEVAPLLAALLEERRPELLAKRLLVLRELESDETHVRAGEPQLRFALGAVLDVLLEAAPSRTDLYLSARPATAGSRPIVRVDLRLRGAAVSEDALDLVLARDLLTRLGATLSLESSPAESRLSIDLAR